MTKSLSQIHDDATTTVGNWDAWNRALAWTTNGGWPIWADTMLEVDGLLNCNEVCKQLPVFCINETTTLSNGEDVDYISLGCRCQILEFAGYQGACTLTQMREQWNIKNRPEGV